MEDLRDKWQRSKDKTESGLINIIASEQARLRGKFGDPNLFQWFEVVRPQKSTQVTF